MARPLRIDDDGDWHHVMNRGLDHQVIYLCDGDRLTFEALLQQLAEQHGIEIHAYCLMGNHYHLLVHCPNGGLSAAMQQLSSSYTRIVNDRLGRDGPLFRGRFHSVPVRSELHISRAAAYIHRNPVDLVGEASLEAYRWSSYGVYLGRRRSPAWLTSSLISDLLPPDLHRDLVANDIEAPGSLEISERSIDQIVGASIDPDSADGRRARLLLGSEVAGMSAQRIASWMDLPSAGAARAAVARARTVRLRSSALDRLVVTVEHELTNTSDLARSTPLQRPA